MRLIRYRINKDNRLLLAELAREHGLEGILVADLYALLRMKGNGIPTSKRIRKMAAAAAKASKGTVSESTLITLANKRVQQLNTMISTSYFKALCQRPDSVEALRVFVTSFQMLNKKLRQAQCISCQYLPQCEFGTQYKNVVRNIGAVLDPDYKLKVHKDCPSLPDIDAVNQLSAASTIFNQLLDDSPQQHILANDDNGMKRSLGDISDLLKKAAAMKEAADQQPEPNVDDDLDDVNAAEPDDTATWAKDMHGTGQAHESVGEYKGDNRGNNFVIQQALIDRLTAQHLCIFDLGKKFSLALTAQKSGKFKPVPTVDKSVTNKNIDSVSDITKLESSQHSLPDELFDQRLVKKSLTKQQSLVREDKKRLLYLLIDNSGSMCGWLGRGATHSNGIMTRGALAATLSIALCESIERDGGIVYVRFFADSTSRLLTAKTKDEFERLRYLLAHASFNGGGTDILASLGVVVHDIKTSTDDVASAEILCVTDCEDTFAVNQLQLTVHGYEFNVLDVSGAKFNSQGASGQLKACATRYYKADESGVNVQDIIKLV